MDGGTLTPTTMVDDDLVSSNTMRDDPDPTASTEQVPPELIALPDELLEKLCVGLGFESGSITSIARLACCCTRLRDMIGSDEACIAPLVDKFGMAATVEAYWREQTRQSKPMRPVPRLPTVPATRLRRAFRTLELLHVAGTVNGLGTGHICPIDHAAKQNRIYFKRKGRAYMTAAATPEIKPGSSPSRIVEAALLLRRHERLSVHIDGHEGSEEGVTHESDGGDPGHMPSPLPMRVSFGASLARAEAVRGALLELECLRGVSRGRRGLPDGAKMWGAMTRVRFAGRVHCRGCEDEVVKRAGWVGVDTAHVEVFFRLDGVELPARADHYAQLPPLPTS